MNRIADSMVGHTDKHGLDLWIAVNPSTQISANTSLGHSITLKMGDAFGCGLVLALDERQANKIVDSLVDALDAARTAYQGKLLQAEGGLDGEN